MMSKNLFFIIFFASSIVLNAQVYNTWLEIVGANKACESLTITTKSEFLTASENDTLILDFGDGIIDTVYNPVSGRLDNHTYNEVGVYIITLTIHNNGGIGVDTDSAFVYAFPDATFSNRIMPYAGVLDTFLFSNRRYLFIANNQQEEAIHSWFINGQIDSLHNDSMGYIFPNIGNQLVKHSIELNGCVQSDSVYIDIKDEEVEIPNIFTPNSDGQNDVFYVKTDGVKRYTFTVWNRFGSRVFIAENMKVISWDGYSYWGELLNPGTYYYVLESETGETYKGFVYISR